MFFSVRAADAQFTLSRTSFPEDVGTATIILTWTGTNTFVRRVNIATQDGTATQPADYTSVSQNSILSVSPGFTTRVDVAIIDDPTGEDDEYFILRVDGADHLITIEANDLSFSLSTKSFAENLGINAKTMLTNTSSSRMRFNLEIKVGTVGASEIRTDSWWFWLDASASREVNLPFSDDNIPEDEEYFILNVNGTDIRISDIMTSGKYRVNHIINFPNIT